MSEKLEVGRKSMLPCVAHEIEDRFGPERLEAALGVVKVGQLRHELLPQVDEQTASVLPIAVFHDDGRRRPSRTGGDQNARFAKAPDQQSGLTEMC